MLYNNPTICTSTMQPAMGVIPMSRDVDGAPPRFGQSTLDDALEAWSEAWEMSSDGASPHEHALSEQRRRMAEPGGLVEADPGLVDHISRCPRCLAEWAAMVRGTAEFDELQGAPGLDYGLFEAAATPGAVRSRTLHTSSGTYELTLSPGMKDSSRGLVILDVVSASAAELEGRRIKAHARASGEVLLDGTVRRGYLAQRHENLAAIDLSRGWTVVVDI